MAMLFFNRDTRAGATGQVSDGSFETLKVFPDQSFGPWTHVAGGGSNHMVFYNSNDRSGCTALIDSDGGIDTLQVFPAFSFGAWTHIIANTGVYLFWNVQSGAGAVATAFGDGSLTTTGIHPDGTFTGWTNGAPGTFVVNPEEPNNIFGRKVILIDRNTTRGSVWEITTQGDVHQSAFFPALGSWTQVGSSSGGDRALLYNQGKKAGTTVKTNSVSGAMTALQTYGDNTFGSWDHVVGVHGFLLFYNSVTRSGAVGEVESNGVHRTHTVYPDNSFGTWTHIVQ